MPNVKNYNRPILKRWGSVSDLTLGGTGTRGDGGNLGHNHGQGSGDSGGDPGGRGGKGSGK